MPTPTIAITRGDPAGIGTEIITKALQDPNCPKNVTWQILGEIPQNNQLGVPTETGALATISALEQAVTGLKQNTFAAVVTAPICKSSLHQAGFPFPGHTEFFASAFGVDEPTMCLTGPRLTVALVTTHCPLSQVPQLLTPQRILRCCTDLAVHLETKLQRTPKIAVAGLNPHAGENGAFGNEEQELITPAIKAAQTTLGKQALIQGPFSPDTIFTQAVNGCFDAVVCLYHDQGLIPLKLLDFEYAVNLTLGLPIIRTSPDHGTAFDLAGKQAANHTSMLAAMQLAAKLATSPSNLAN